MGARWVAGSAVLFIKNLRVCDPLCLYTHCPSKKMRFSPPSMQVDDALGVSSILRYGLAYQGTASAVTTYVQSLVNAMQGGASQVLKVFSTLETTLASYGLQAPVLCANNLVPDTNGRCGCKQGYHFDETNAKCAPRTRKCTRLSRSSMALCRMHCISHHTIVTHLVGPGPISQQQS